MEEMVTHNVSTQTNGYATNIGLVLASMGLGALLMYLFDPDRGRGRRAQLRDQVSSKVRHAGEAAEAKARDLRNRAKGLMHEVGIFPTGDENDRWSHNEPSTQETVSAVRAAGIHS